MRQWLGRRCGLSFDLARRWCLQAAAATRWACQSSLIHVEEQPRPLRGPVSGQCACLGAARRRAPLASSEPRPPSHRAGDHAGHVETDRGEKGLLETPQHQELQVKPPHYPPHPPSSSPLWSQAWRARVPCPLLARQQVLCASRPAGNFALLRPRRLETWSTLADPCATSARQAPRDGTRRHRGRRRRRGQDPAAVRYPRARCCLLYTRPRGICAQMPWARSHARAQARASFVCALRWLEPFALSQNLHTPLPLSSRAPALAGGHSRSLIRERTTPGVMARKIRMRTRWTPQAALLTCRSKTLPRAAIVSVRRHSTATHRTHRRRRALPDPTPPHPAYHRRCSALLAGGCVPLVLSARRWHGCGATRPTARRGIGGKLRMRAPARALVLIIVRPCMLAENQER